MTVYELIYVLIAGATFPVLFADPDPALAISVWVLVFALVRLNRHVLDPICCDPMRGQWAINLTPVLVIVQLAIDCVVPTLGSAMVLIGHLQTIRGARDACGCPNARVIATGSRRSA